MLKLSKTNVAPYDFLSANGAMTNPVVVSLTIDKSGGTVTSSPVQAYLVAQFDENIRSYTEISVTPTTPQAGLTWEVSLNGTTWSASITPADMGDGVAQTDVTTPVWTRVIADNGVESPLATGNYAAEFAVAATENPPA